jgi:nucleoside-diphosphate-sugar epimerase
MSLRIVVTGASGNLGTSVVQALGGDDRVESVLGMARREPEWPSPKLTWVTADVSTDTREDLERRLAGADAVIHLAWQFQPTHDPVATWRNNVLGGIRVFEAVGRLGIGALIYSSSVGAYSPGPKDKDMAVDESWPTHGWPAAAYCREKAYLERWLDGFEAHHPATRVVRIRPAFLFKRESASEQRRLFAGPLLPGMLMRRGLIPAVPDVCGLRLQALHTDDAAQAFLLATLSDVRGAFNIAADPPVDAPMLAELLGTRRLPLPRGMLRVPLTTAWWLRLVPASPDLFDAVLRLPIMDTTRARTELGWTPLRTATEAVEELLAGLREGAGLATPPLSARVKGGRLRELLAGAGRRA